MKVDGETGDERENAGGKGKGGENEEVPKRRVMKK